MYKVVGSYKTRTQRVLWALEEIGVPYEWINARPQSDEVRKFTAAGKVPALVIDENVLVDSEAILSYICDRHGSLGALAGTIERAQQDAHLAYAIEHIDAPLWMKMRIKRLSGLVGPEFEEGVSLILSTAFEQIGAHVRTREYLMGGNFTIANIYTAHSLGWAKGEGYPLPKETLAYYRRCYARPAAQQMRTKYL